MDTKEVKKYLSTYAGLKKTVENQLERIQRAKYDTEIPALKMGDGSSSGGGHSDRMANSVIKWMDLKERLMPAIEEKVEKMRLIERIVDSLEDGFEVEVLRLRYIDCDHCRLMPWRDVAMKLYGDDDEAQLQATYRLHGRALQSFVRKMEDSKK